MQVQDQYGHWQLSLLLLNGEEEINLSMNINEIFEKLSWNSNKESQLEAIEEASNIKLLSIFIQPVEDKSIWENCAKIISKKSDKVLEHYLIDLFEWYQDSNWPGYDIIYDRIFKMSGDLLSCAYSICLDYAMQTEDEQWLINLSGLKTKPDLYKLLSVSHKSLVDEYYKQYIQYN